MPPPATTTTPPGDAHTGENASARLADDTLVDATGVPPTAGWDVPAEAKADTTEPSEEDAAKNPNKHERRRRGTLPPPTW